MKSPWPAPTTTMTLTVPVASVEFVAGETRAANIQSAEDPYYGSVTQAAWPLSLAQDQAQSMTAALRITQNGYYNIHAYAFTDLGAGGRYGGRADLYLVIDGTEVWVGSQPPKNNWVAGNIGIPGSYNPSLAEQIHVRLYLDEPLQWGKETVLVYEITPLVDIRDRVSIGLKLPKVGLAVMGREDPSQKALSFQPAKASENLSQSSDSGFTRPDSDCVMHWEGYMTRGETVVIRLRIKPTTTGEGGITAYVNVPTSSGTGTTYYIGDLKLNVYVPNMAE